MDSVFFTVWKLVYTVENNVCTTTLKWMVEVSVWCLMSPVKWSNLHTQHSSSSSVRSCCNCKLHISFPGTVRKMAGPTVRPSDMVTLGSKIWLSEKGSKWLDIHVIAVAFILPWQHGRPNRCLLTTDMSDFPASGPKIAWLAWDAAYFSIGNGHGLVLYLKKQYGYGLV